MNSSQWVSFLEVSPAISIHLHWKRSRGYGMITKARNILFDVFSQTASDRKLYRKRWSNNNFGPKPGLGPRLDLGFKWTNRACRFSERAHLDLGFVTKSGSDPNMGLHFFRVDLALDAWGVLGVVQWSWDHASHMVNWGHALPICASVASLENVTVVALWFGSPRKVASKLFIIKRLETLMIRWGNQSYHPNLRKKGETQNNGLRYATLLTPRFSSKSAIRLCGEKKPLMVWWVKK